MSDVNRNIRIFIEAGDSAAKVKSLESAIGELESRLTSLSASESGYGNKKAALAKDLQAKTNTLNKYKASIAETTRVLNNLSGATYDELIAVQRVVREQLRKAVPGTKAYTLALEQNKRVTMQVAAANSAMSVQIGKNSGFMSKAATTINKYMGFAMMAGSALVALGISMKSIIQRNAELADSYADVSRTTGLSLLQVRELDKEFRQLDTRTPRKELLALASDAGKLGLSAKQDVLEFVRAADKINVALGEDLGEDAVTNLAKLNQIFGETKKLGVEKSMMATGSAINELGQRSTAAEAYLVDLAKRIGGVGSISRMSIQAILALGSTLDQFGQSAEVSGTALNQILIKMLSDTGTVAKAAGVDVNELNAAIGRSGDEGLVMVLEGLAKNKNGLAELAPVFKDLGSEGVRASSVITTLVSHVDVLKEQIDISSKAYSDGTSIINEFEKKNKNLAGTLSKLGKNIATWFTSSSFNNWLTSVVEALEELTHKNKNLTQQTNDLTKSTAALVTDTLPLIDRLEQLQSKTNLSALESKELKSLIEQISGVIPTAVTQWDAYGNAIGVSTVKAREFIESEKARLKYVNAASLKQQQDELDRISKKIDNRQKFLNNGQTVDQYNPSPIVGMPTSVVRSMSGAEKTALSKELKQLQDRKAGIEAEISRLSGDALTKELQRQEDEKEAALDLAKQKAIYASKSKADLKALADGGDALAKEIYTTLYPALVATGEAGLSASDKIKKGLDEVTKQYLAMGIANKKAYVDGTINQEEYTKRSAELAIEELEAKKKVLKKTSEEYLQAEDKIFDYKVKAIDEALKKDEEAAKRRKELEEDLAQWNLQEDDAKVGMAMDEIGTRQAAEEAEALMRYESNLSSEDQYQQEMLAIQEKYLDEKLTIVGLTEAEITALKREQIKVQAKEQKLATKQQIKMIEAAAEAAGNVSNIVGMLQETEINNMEAKYDAEIAAAGTNTEEIERLEQEKEEKKLAIQKKYADINFGIKAAEIIANTAVAIMKTLAELGPIAGPIAAALIGATGAAQLLVANSERNKIKNMTVSRTSAGGSSSGSTTMVVDQRAAGKYDVIGADDGKTYRNVPYVGTPTGIVTSPALIAESGSELIINSADLARLQQHVNYGIVLQAIRESRGSMPQRAEGNYSNVPATSSQAALPGSTSTNSMTPEVMAELLSLLRYLKTYGVKAPIVLSELDKARALADKSKSIAKK